MNLALPRQAGEPVDVGGKPFESIGRQAAGAVEGLAADQAAKWRAVEMPA